MDGRIRAHRLALFSFLTVVAASCVSGPAGAADNNNRFASKSPLYISPRLDREFLGAVSVDLRVDATTLAPSRRAELELLSKNPAKSPKLRSRIVPITLERTSPREGSRSESAPSDTGLTYVVSGIPPELLRRGEILQLILSSGSDQRDTARLTLCGSDGKPSLDIKLIRVKAHEPVKLESDAQQAPR
jgi:hypothetical protein